MRSTSVIDASAVRLETPRTSTTQSGGRSTGGVPTRLAELKTCSKPIHAFPDIPRI